LVRRSTAEASGNAPTELPPYRSVRGSSEPPRARCVISQGSVQKKVRISTKRYRQFTISARESEQWRSAKGGSGGKKRRRKATKDETASSCRRAV